MLGNSRDKFVKRFPPVDNRPRYLRYAELSSRGAAREPELFSNRNSDQYDDVRQSRHDIRSHRRPVVGQVEPGAYRSQDYEFAQGAQRMRGGRVQFEDRGDFHVEGEECGDEYGEAEGPEYIIPNRGSIVDNRIVRYQKQQLPQFQGYQQEHSQQFLPAVRGYDREQEYDYARRGAKLRLNLSFSAVWQKFVITFTSLLSLVCISWIVYNWNGAKSGAGDIPEVLSPESPTFKVLPDVPGGSEIPYQDKEIYDRVDPSLASPHDSENVLPSSDEPDDIPDDDMPLLAKTSQAPAPLEEYAIVDDSDYYVKCKLEKDGAVAKGQFDLMKKRLSSFPNKDTIRQAKCDIKTVVNKAGAKDLAILIGPFGTQEAAAVVARHVGAKGNIITVKKKYN